MHETDATTITSRRVMTDRVALWRILSICSLTDIDASSAEVAAPAREAIGRILALLRGERTGLLAEGLFLPHVREADEAIHIGGSASADSYLAGERIIHAAKAAGLHEQFGVQLAFTRSGAARAAGSSARTGVEMEAAWPRASRA